jgi:TPP-dependent indolepyruvate ferredoxin oxidoreductase alpha subunit
VDLVGRDLRLAHVHEHVHERVVDERRLGRVLEGHADEAVALAVRDLELERDILGLQAALDVTRHAIQLVLDSLVYQHVVLEQQAALEIQAQRQRVDAVQEDLAPPLSCLLRDLAIELAVRGIDE